MKIRGNFGKTGFFLSITAWVLVFLALGVACQVIAFCAFLIGALGSIASVVGLFHERPRRYAVAGAIISALFWVLCLWPVTVYKTLGYGLIIVCRRSISNYPFP
jgi:hypothetical protein